jgi:hypothetical protein
MNRGQRKPWLFMDLDGVVSPVPPQSAKARISRNGPPAGYRSWPGALYDMYVDERFLDWAAQLDRVYDVVWSSSWEDTLLPVVAQPLGLDHWPVLSSPRTNDSEFGTGRLSAKTEAIGEHLASDPRPFASCDDYLDRRSLPATLRPLQLPHLLVSPRTRSGLTPEHIEQLLEFADHQTRQCRPVTRPVRSPSTRGKRRRREHMSSGHVFGGASRLIGASSPGASGLLMSCCILAPLLRRSTSTRIQSASALAQALATSPA